MRKRTATKIIACMLAAFHVVVVVIPVVSSHANGESQAFTVLLFDWPLVLLVEALPHGSSILYDNMTAYQRVFCLGGTLMYAGVGALIGWVFDAIRHANRPA